MSKKKKSQKKAGPSTVQGGVSVESEALKEAGRSLFKAGKFVEAAEKYSQAEELCPAVPAYPVMSWLCVQA
ncbi:hypothetical protein B0H16DRAFT_1729406 [Mycena metata]|uniref:Uncharacterized protein n=1 Tax=Mycena metata TaxID=1033252 RepID=A0AAD7ID41_9AGAR|nr:hypothetical protein B0H16DRAFT_1729406 [Mycena metata]